MKRRLLLSLAVLLAISAAVALAQRQNGPIRTARDIPQDGPPTPEWTNTAGFEKDVFTFLRVQYSPSRGSSFRRYGGGNWTTDTPDSDLNLSYRLQQLTSLDVDPKGRAIELTEPALADFPWIYIVEPGWLVFSNEEVEALRKYLLNGGFLLVDDFWGDYQWENFYREIKRVFPDLEPEELEMSHPIFHCAIDIKLTKQELQVPNVGDGMRSEMTGITWEQRWGPSAEEVHFKAIFDDKRRMMVFIAHNTDNGDGWEREGESAYYFREFSEKKAYPLGINVVFYAMTH